MKKITQRELYGIAKLCAFLPEQDRERYLEQQFDKLEDCECEDLDAKVVRLQDMYNTMLDDKNFMMGL